jgi:ABC-type lipoprotein export system ATPase subunit
MNITLQHILPHPLASIQHSPQSIWGNEIELKSGTHVMLNASSGKGKSTFTNTLFGLRQDYDGKLLFDGRDARELNASEWTDLRMRKLSVVFQDLQLFPKLTVRENLVLKNALTDAYTEAELQQLLESFGIGDKWNQSCGLLSMGQQQRVAILRALAQPYEWLILDEPFSHLDSENARICLEAIEKRTRQLGAGFVLTTLGDHYGYHYDHELKL